MQSLERKLDRVLEIMSSDPDAAIHKEQARKLDQILQMLYWQTHVLIAIGQQLSAGSDDDALKAAAKKLNDSASNLQRSVAANQPNNP